MYLYMFTLYILYKVLLKKQHNKKINYRHSFFNILRTHMYRHY